MHVLLGLAFSCFVSVAISAGPDFKLPSYPLAVRTPYVNAWLHGSKATDAARNEPQFWNGQTLGWQVAARIDGTTYPLMGFPNGLSGSKGATQKSIEITATHTTIDYTAGSSSITLDFFSPVAPKNFTRQSLPFSYLTVSVKSASSHVQVFSSTDERWTSQQGNVNTAVKTTGNTVNFQLYNPGQTLFAENGDMAAWGTFVYGSKPSSTSSMTYQCGDASALATAFYKTGALTNSAKSCPRSGSVGFAHDLFPNSSAINLNLLSQGTSSVTFGIGLEQDNVIDFHGTRQKAYLLSDFADVTSAFVAFLSDYSSALAASRTLDNTIRSKGLSVSSHYADILDASTRQAFAPFTFSTGTAFGETESRLRLWVKEISSDGNVNTVDVIYPTLPILYALNPDMLKLVVDPILQYVSTPNTWIEDFALHDLGARFPNATGHDDQMDEYMPVQTTANLLEEVYAYQHATGDASFAETYKTVLLRYGDYLIANGMAHQAQLSTVDALPATSNQTQLAAGSAIGLASLGAMFASSDPTTAQKYTNAGKAQARQLFDGGLALDAAKTHFLFNYPSSPANDPTWSPLFPLYTDAMLGLNVFPSAARTLMSDWYASQFRAYGLPYRETSNPTGSPFSISDWAFWGAATSNATVLDGVVDGVWKFLQDGQSDLAFQTKYNVDTGAPIANTARSTVGANFAPVVLDGPWS